MEESTDAPTCCFWRAPLLQTRISEISSENNTLQSTCFLPGLLRNPGRLLAPGEERLCLRPCHRQTEVRAKLHHLPWNKHHKLKEIRTSSRCCPHPCPAPILPLPGSGNAVAHPSTPQSQTPHPPSCGRLPHRLPPAGCKETAPAAMPLLGNCNPCPQGRGPVDWSADGRKTVLNLDQATAVPPITSQPG